MKLFILAFVLAACPIFGQDAYLQKNDGTKIAIDDDSVRIITNEKKVVYKPLNKGGVQTIDFNEFDNFSYSNFKFRTLNLNKRPEKDGYFVLAESSNKFLIFKILTPVPQEEDEVVKPSFQMLIIDNQYNTLSSFSYNDETNSKSIEARNQILLNIKTAFPTCDNLINRFSDYDKKNGDLKNLSILGIFNSPVFIDCK